MILDFSHDRVYPHLEEMWVYPLTALPLKGTPMPYPLCRHIMSTGHHCQSPSLKDQNFCYHHNRQRRLTARPRRPYSVTIPFEFPEDRAAIQTNYHLAQLAVLEGKLEPQQARAIISANRAAAVNLKAGPLTNPGLKHRVDRVILTPEGEEIAPAREALHPGETLTHGPECPCGICADTYRNAPGELHHPDCNCGLCDDSEEPEPVLPEPSHQPWVPHPSTQAQPAEKGGKDRISTSDSHSEQAERSEEPALPLNQPQPPAAPVVFTNRLDAYNAARAAELKAALADKNAPTPPATIPSIQATADGPSSCPAKHAKAAKRHPAIAEVASAQPYIDKEEDSEEDSGSPYQAVIREYYEQLAARQAARAAGTAPPPAPRDPNRQIPEGIRRYNELMAQIERNKQLAEESWQRFVAAERAAGREVVDPLASRAILTTNPDGTTSRRYLTWNEEEDLRRANWQRLLDEDAVRNTDEGAPHLEEMWDKSLTGS
jgi:hypothetical protein